MQAPKLDRTPSCHRGATAGAWCLERSFDGQDDHRPVKLVVFDCDETLTVSTFMPREKEFGTTIGWSEWPEYISNVNFESEFVDGSRLERLKELLSQLRGSETANGPERALAVLTRNERGCVACLNLLMMAGLADFFSVVWAMPDRPGVPAGVYRHEGNWKTFDPPLADVYDHKAEVLARVASHPEAWLPMLQHGQMQCLKELRFESIVLVDDVRTNFQSPVSREAKLLRYCKVARYDAHHPQMGFVTDMGGLGAMSLADYATLKAFVERPWEFQASSALECMESSFDTCLDRPGVQLVVFEFDETLSLCTFVVEEPRFATEIGYCGSATNAKEHSVLYNFESPYVDGSRVAKLATLLDNLTQGGSRTLAILTENTAGAVAVLNLLLSADLAKYFKAVWAPMADHERPTGVYLDDAGQWLQFQLRRVPLQGRSTRAEVLNNIADRPSEWFPQLATGKPSSSLAELMLLTSSGIVTVDDDRTNFHATHSGSQSVPRYCRVGRYDDDYRDQGFIIHMGGIGAKNDKDYEVLQRFVEKPWQYRVGSPQLSPEQLLAQLPAATDDVENTPPLQRRLTEDYLEKPLRGRTLSSSSLA